MNDSGHAPYDDACPASMVTCVQLRGMQRRWRVGED